MQKGLWQPTILQNSKPQRLKLYPIKISEDECLLVWTLFADTRPSRFGQLPQTFRETMLEALSRITNSENPIPFHPDFACDIGLRSGVTGLNSSDYIRYRLPTINRRRYGCSEAERPVATIIEDVAGCLVERIKSKDLQGMCLFGYRTSIDFCAQLPEPNPWRVYKYKKRQPKWYGPQQSTLCSARFFHLTLDVCGDDLYFSEVYLD